MMADRLGSNPGLLSAAQPLVGTLDAAGGLSSRARWRDREKANSPRAVRILHVVRRLDFGGLEVGVINLVHGLQRLGFDQAVCCLETRGKLADRLPDSVPVWSCGDDRAGQRVPWRAARRVRAWRPDVLHARNCGAWIDATTAWLLAGRPGRLAFSIHGWEHLDPIPRRRAWLFRQMARLTPALAAVSAETARQFAAETGIAVDRLQVLRSGVDTTRLRPSQKPRDQGRHVLGCVARLAPVKAHDLLIDAFARVVERGVANLELRLIGDGPLRPDLTLLARERGVADRVRFVGMADDVPEQLRELDLFVLASHREGRPTSIMEAMASGLPVVATRVGSIPDLVDDGRTGLLVEPGDADGLARALGRLVGDEALRRRLAEQARRVAVADLSLERMVEQYATFYREIARDA